MPSRCCTDNTNSLPVVWDRVFGCDESARVAPSRYVVEAHVAARWTKKRYPFADDHRHACDGHSIDQSRVQKTLNRDATIDVEMRHAPLRASVHEVAWRARPEVNLGA